jgi:hypothetical protein
VHEGAQLDLLVAGLQLQLQALHLQAVGRLAHRFGLELAGAQGALGGRRLAPCLGQQPPRLLQLRLR